jgi:outer membrane receptor protein involved in Fe transport
MRKLILAALIGVFLFAADYGRIVGTVTDSETGAPLVGADVIIEGTELGAATDENGEYVVLYVPVGTYRISASYISFDPFSFTNVVVIADQTTMLDFRLRPTVIEVKGVTAVAERPMVVISQTQTGRAVTSQEMERLPVTTINQVISLQAGVYNSVRGTHVRGGRTDEVVYYMDGIATMVPNFGIQSTIVAPSAVQEVDVVSGGFDAEYGDALSGVINIYTKEGGARTSGSFSFLSDEMFSSWQDQLNRGYNLYDVTLGGPLPGISRLRYFLGGEYMNTDSYQKSLYKIPAPRNEYRGQARLSYLFPNAKGKLAFSAFTERRQYIWYGLPASPPYSFNRKYFANRPMDQRKNWVYSGNFNYMATAKTLLSLKVGMTKYERLYGNRDYDWEDSVGLEWYEDWRLVGEQYIPLLLDEDLRGDSITIRNVLVDSLIRWHTEPTNRDIEAIRNSPYQLEGRHFTAGKERTWVYQNNQDYQGRFDVTHSIGKVHELKSGVDFTQYHVRYFNNGLPHDANPFYDIYDKKPLKIAGYFQDKMDFEGIIARLGLRVDYFDAKAFSYDQPNDFLNDTLTYSEKTFQVSPRIGFSLPVTDRLKLRFNYGHYWQIPSLNDIYTTNDTSMVRIAIVRGNTLIGNVSLRPERTVSYEVGLENQLTDVFAVGFTGYFKNIYDLSSFRTVVAQPVSYYQSFNVDYGNVKGFEISLQKRMADMWAFGINYTLQFAKGTGADVYDFVNNYYYFQGSEPVIDYYLDFDERHVVNANLDFALPIDFFLLPLQDFTSSFVFSYHSGMPYTLKNLRGDALGTINSARMPGYWNMDWNFNRRIKIGPVYLTLNGLIDNLFNTTQVSSVHETTGDPDWHGDPEPSLDQFTVLTIAQSRYSPQADFNHDGLITRIERKQDYILCIEDFYRCPINYYDGFRARFGVGLSF